MSLSHWFNPPSIEGATYGPLVNSTLRSTCMREGACLPVQYRVVNVGGGVMGWA